MGNNYSKKDYWVQPETNEWFLEKLKEDNITFEQLYYGNWETDPCNGCPNNKPNRICHCTLGTPNIN